MSKLGRSVVSLVVGMSQAQKGDRASRTEYPPRVLLQ